MQFTGSISVRTRCQKKRYAQKLRSSFVVAYDDEFPWTSHQEDIDYV